MPRHGSACQAIGVPQSHHPATAFKASRPNLFIHTPVHANMPIARPSWFTTSLHVRLFMLTLKWGYRLTIRREGSWFESLIQEAAPHSGERILEVSADDFSAAAALARQYPAVHFSAMHPTGSNKSVPESPINLELLHGDQRSVDCRAASFDKVICSFALHPLPLNKKLALLKEIKRVLRHGGTLHLADFDQPQQPLENRMLRGYLFGPETAAPHLDGTWLNLIKQAGFVGVRRVTTFSQIVGRIAIVRARRG